MSRPRVGISTTYKTRVALEVIVRNGRESVLDSYRTGGDAEVQKFVSFLRDLCRDSNQFTRNPQKTRGTDGAAEAF
jgi:hypothetical protein